MEDLLFLAHRMPYPPTKGDKIRSFNILCHLAKRYRVHLGAFVDDPADWRHAGALDAFCESKFLMAINPATAKLRALQGLFTGEPLSVRYYRNKAMKSWVRWQLRKRGIRKVFIFSSAMGQFVDEELTRHARVIIDFVDVDSEKWRDYGKAHVWPMSGLYSREAKRLLQHDAEIAGRFDVGLFVSEEEARLFRRLVPSAAGKVTMLENGVDLQYFDPGSYHANPYDPHMRALVFTGAMDYWPNIDAVTWYASVVFPRVRERFPNCALFVVGARPAEPVKTLADGASIFVTGAVYDIRPYLVHAAAAIAPLRVARGVQNKVLEAMAMGLPVVATSAAALGIDLSGVKGLYVAEDAEGLVELSLRLLTSEANPDIAKSLRESVRTRYDWTQNLSRLESLLECSDWVAASSESTGLRGLADAV